MSLSPLYRALTNDLHVSTAMPTSIAVSSDFVVARHRSPPFGSHRTRSRSTGRPEDKGTTSAVAEGGASYFVRKGVFFCPPRFLFVRTQTFAFFSPQRFFFFVSPRTVVFFPVGDRHRFHFASWIRLRGLSSRITRDCSRLLGPCFKTGGSELSSHRGFA